MKFNKKFYVNGEEQNETVETTEKDVKTTLHFKFCWDDEVARYEEMTLADGRFCVAIKDRSNKIIVQYKQIKT